MAGNFSTAGGALGTFFGGPSGSALGAGIGGLFDGAMMGGSGPGASGPAGPSAAAVAVYGSGLNGDNWNVNFRGSQSNTSSAYKPFEATGPTAAAAGQGGYAAPLPSAPGAAYGSGAPLNLSMVPGWAWAVGAGLIAWKALRSGR